MGNQHTGAPVLKGGLLQRYQLQAPCAAASHRDRAGHEAAQCGSRCQQIPAHPSTSQPCLALPCPVLPGSAPLCPCAPRHRFSLIFTLKHCPALPRWGDASMARWCGKLGSSPGCFIPVPFGFVWPLCVCASPAASLGFSRTAPGLSVLSQTNLEIIGSLAVPGSPQWWSTELSELQLCPNPPRAAARSALCCWRGLSVCYCWEHLHRIASEMSEFG